MKNRRFPRSAAIALSLLFLVPSGTAFAQQGTQTSQAGLTILSAPVDYINIDPGQTVSGTLRVRNTDTVPHSAVARTRDWVPGKDPGSVNLLEGGKNEQAQNPSPYPLAAWITVAPQSQVIQPGQEVEFTYQIAAPMKASPGGHYGAIGFSMDTPVEPTDQSGVAISPRIYKLFFVTVSGDVQYAAEIRSFAVKRDDAVPKDERVRVPGEKEALTSETVSGYRFDTSIFNDGNVHFKPRGYSIKITNVFGRRVREIEDVDAREKNILPHSERTIRTYWAKRPWPGVYKAKVSFLYGADNGPFLPASKSTYFYVIPPLWFNLLLLLLLIILFLVWRSRRKIRRAMRAYRESV